MRQPKYQLGVSVTFPLEVTSREANITVDVMHQGIIIGVGYAPGQDGAPRYIYRINPKGSKNYVHVPEGVIMDEEADTGAEFIRRELIDPGSSCAPNRKVSA